MNDGISPTPASREQAEQQDSSHLIAPGGSAKSLQPLLDAPEQPWTADTKPHRFELPPASKSDAFCDPQCGFRACKEAQQCTMRDDPPCGHMRRGIRKPYCARCDRAALGNRTPARQEERPSEKESVSAPLPVQGQEASNVLPIQGYIDWQQRRGISEDILDEAQSAYAQWMIDDDYDAHTFIRTVFDRIEERRAALRASSAPTTKG